MVTSLNLELARIEKFSDMTPINLLRVLSLSVSVWEPRLPISMSVVSSGTSKSNSNKLSMRPTERASSERMLAVADMTLMFMFNLALVLISVEKNQLLLRASRVSPVDPD